MSVSSRTRSKLKQRDEPTSLLLNLPEVIHDEIFLKLPARSILLSRCVCKHFNNLLSKPRFIKNHVNRNNQIKNGNPKLLFSQSSEGNPPMIYSIPIDYLSISSPPPSLSDGAVQINYPFESMEIYLFKFLGSCNGLICSSMLSIDRPSQNKITLETIFCVLNPLTREFKEFRNPEKKRYGGETCGFGYDSNIDDYKLVVISNYEKDNCCQIDVYTVKSGSWSSVQGTFEFSFRSGEGYPGVSFNGRLHWLASIDNHGTSSGVIISFDISNEIVVNMPLPENIMPPTDYAGDVYKNVVLWGDCIGVACIWGSVRIDVWVMQEYGVKESWIKKYTTTQLPSPSREIPFWRPLWCFNNGEILIDTDCKQLVLCNPTSERVRSVVVCDIAMASSRESYVESIVSLGSGTYLKKPITDGVVKNSEPRRLRGGRHQTT